METARDLWRLARELRHGEAGAWLTTLASLLIVVMAAWNIMKRFGSWIRRTEQPNRDEEFPEGA